MYELTEEDLNWIQQRVTETPGMTVEMITEWFHEAIEELKTIGLDVGMGCVEGEPYPPQFLNMVHTAAIGRLQANIAPEPSEFQLMILGPYPERKAGKKPIVEIIAVASPDGVTQKMSTLTAWDKLTKVKNDFEPLGSYQTDVTYLKEDEKKDDVMFTLSVQGATVFSDETKCDFRGKTYDEKILDLQSIIPTIPLNTVNQNLSTMKKDPKSSKSYVNGVDLKKISIKVVDTNDGVDKNGRSWAMYHVIDGTFKPTLKVKTFPVWVDPSVFNNLQAGEGSYLEIYGTLQKREGEETASMSACFVHPLAVVPLIQKPDVAKTDNPGGNVIVPTEPIINVMSSGGM